MHMQELKAEREKMGQLEEQVSSLKLQVGKSKEDAVQL